MKASLLAFVLLVGCNNSAIGLDAGSVPTLNDYLRESAQLGCKYLVRCGTTSKSQEAAGESWIGGYDTAALSAASKGIAAGRLSYNAGAAASCLNALGTATCDLSTLLMADASSSCAAIIEPKVAVGGACELDSECDHGFCNMGGASPTACAGTCTAFVATGATCDGVSGRCAATDFCSSTNVCTALLGRGQACDEFSLECGAGLSCATIGTTSTCLPPAAEGAPCDTSAFTNACANSGLYCNTSTTPNPTCQKRQPIGGVCNSDGSGCAAGLACVVVDDTMPTGSCQAFLDVGQACTGTTSSACAGDATCDPTSQKCQLQGQAGADCSIGSCATQFYCNAANQCAARISLGQPCTPATTSVEDPCLATECDPTSLTCSLICS